MQDSNITRITDVQADIEFERCLEYVHSMRQNISQKDFGKQYGVTDRTVRNWIVHWEQNGMLEKARAMVLLPELDGIDAAYDRVLIDFPAILDNLVQIALGNGPRISPRTQWEVGAWLHENIVRPKEEKGFRVDSAAKSYLEEDTDFDPINITPKVISPGD